MSFDAFNLPEPVMRAVRDMHYTQPTPIQEKAIPLILEGKDVVGQSETGSGKTAAFGLPLLGRLQPQGTQMLVLTPTRELCMQVKQSLTHFARHLRINVAAVYGGVGMGPQIHALRTAHIIVACPGRLLDHCERGTANLSRIKYLILDEADRMFDMGFIRDIERILRALPKERQTLLFSATMPREVKALVQRYMRNPHFVETTVHVDKDKLHEYYYEVRQDDKFSLLVHLLKHETPGTALVFCGTRRIVDKITRNLRRLEIKALAIHGGLSQSKRDMAIDMLHRGKTPVLVATDIAARGLHIKSITHVYNYDLPNVAEDYTHRIGRTARAGAEGDAITILSDRDRPLMRPILRLGHNIIRRELPRFERVVPPQGQQETPEREGHKHRGFRHKGKKQWRR